MGSTTEKAISSQNFVSVKTVALMRLGPEVELNWFELKHHPRPPLMGEAIRGRGRIELV
jgi:hypothetical protein